MGWGDACFYKVVALGDAWLDLNLFAYYFWAKSLAGAGDVMSGYFFELADLGYAFYSKTLTIS